MKLRTRLFICIGLIFVVVSLLTFILPNYLVKKDLEEASSEIESKQSTQEKRMYDFINLVFLQFFKLARNNLEHLEKTVSTSDFAQTSLKQKNIEQLNNIAEQLLNLETGIAFVQFNDSEGKLLLILPKENKELAVGNVSSNQYFLANIDTGNIFLISNQPMQAGSVTLAFSFSSFISNMARTLKKIVLFQDDEILIGYDETGKYDKNLSKIPKNEMVSSKGSLVFDNQTFNYQKLHLIDQNQFLYFLIPQSQALSIIPFMEGIHDRITKKIAFDLSSVILVCLPLALIVISQVAKKIARPISQLAQAAKKVSEGQYHEAHLPKQALPTSEISTLYHSFDNMVGALKDREKIRGMLNKVVSKEIADQILTQKITLEGEERFGSLLFSDIRGFTPFSEKVPPKELFETMNFYLNLMCKVIDENKGVVDKFVGDEIMTLYGIPVDHPDHAFHAVSTAVLMMQELHKWNEERQKNQKDPIYIGIGIHTGTVYAGNIGATDRMNYTVLGANVNLASRLCSIAEPMQILISKETLEAHNVKETFRYKQLASSHLKGIDHLVECFEIQWRSIDTIFHIG